MRKQGLFALFLALCAGLVFVTPVTGVNAKPKKKKEEVSKDAPAPLDKTPKLRPKGLRFGLSPKALANLYDKVIDRDYLARYKEAEPGIQQERLKNEVDTKKRVFRQSYKKLDHSPGAMDGTSFEGEFAYGNKEGFMRIKRKGRWRYFFFWKQKLYKVIDIHRLGEKKKWGKTFKTAATKVEKAIGKEGRKLDADEDEGRNHNEVDWADSSTHFRVINWSKRKVAFGWVNKKIESSIVKARAKVKAKEKKDLDPGVKRILRKKKKGKKGK